MCLNSGPLQERYTDEVDTRVAADLASGLAVPTKEEHPGRAPVAVARPFRR